MRFVSDSLVTVISGPGVETLRDLAITIKMPSWMIPKSAMNASAGTDIDIPAPYPLTDSDVKPGISRIVQDNPVAHNPDRRLARVPFQGVFSDFPEGKKLTGINRHKRDSIFAVF